MSDFKSSTQAMLEAVRAEKAKLKERLAQLDVREKTILGWMKEETPQGDLLAAAAEPKRGYLVLKPRLGSFLRSVIEDGTPRSNAELAELAKAKGVVTEDMNLRSINSVMLSFMNAGLVKREHDKWVARKQN